MEGLFSGCQWMSDLLSGCQLMAGLYSGCQLMAAYLVGVFGFFRPAKHHETSEIKSTKNSTGNFYYIDAMHRRREKTSQSVVSIHYDVTFLSSDKKLSFPKEVLNIVLLLS